jgi:hypothetical protein
LFETIDEISEFISGPLAELFSHDGVIGLLHPSMRRSSGCGDSDHLGATVVGIGTALDVSLGLERLHLTGERSRMDTPGLSKITHTQRSVVDDLSENCHCSEPDGHLRPFGFDAIQSL